MALSELELMEFYEFSELGITAKIVLILKSVKSWFRQFEIRLYLRLKQ